MATDPNEPPRHSVSVAAAILDDQGRFLVIRRADNGNWEPPGGVLELDESITDGLVREVHEETGLDIRPLALTGVYKNMIRGIVALVFRCDVIAGTARASDEAAEVDWLRPEELMRRMSDAYSARLLDALTLDLRPAVRAHDGIRISP
ncbi:NUDIX domain-containing protein [Solirubrobacter ginsenosidimutans]|uniref:NUDIX domain-containing protein n=1 Tax=Solirubrobacter ginsenosidimutans TaxID=490573 RepID=A0A9X3MQX5_9ACTN|nr:NUDIX domain-containing protein [Solirubrobacter ginsenosidimutans]MDA0159573.1 NUDIX domain-containing protein [Solirubrobacter ginsenosidimutans]